MFYFGDMLFDSRQDAQAWCDERLRYAACGDGVLKASEYVGPGAKSLPFSGLAVGDVVVFDMPIRSIQARAHSHGQYAGKKFKTWQEWPCLLIKRVS